MKKIDTAIKKETLYIAAWVIVLSALMQAIFLIVAQFTSLTWDYTFLLGNLLSAGIGILNFFLMGLSVQRALSKDEKGAKNTMKISQLYRFLLLVLVLIIGIVLPCFSNWTVIIPVFFPRIALFIRPLFNKKAK